MSKRFSEAFKQKMVGRLVGKNAVTAGQLSRETGVQQQNLSRWLSDARSLPFVASDKPKNDDRRPVEDKARIVAKAAELEGAPLAAYLRQEGVGIADLERWRLALEDREPASRLLSKQVKKLQRELERKDKALAEVAALLVLKKKVDALYSADEDDDTDEENDK